MRTFRTKPRDRSALDAAKSRVPISTAWHALGLPGAPRAICRSPFREDRHPSFSVTNDSVWHDFATGHGGDVVAFVKHAVGCGDAEAINRVLAMAQCSEISVSNSPTPRSPKAPEAQRPLKAPALIKPTISDLAAIERIRGWPLFAGLEVAIQRGLLYSCTMTDDGAPRPAWAITDSARRSVQVRRIDGRPWSWNNAKAWTLGGSIAGWPIGAADIGARRLVLLCEGGPDFLAAYTLAWLADRTSSVAVVCVPGATASLHTDALPFFAGRHVRIFEHADRAGSDAGQRWSGQLKEAGATVDGFTFDAPHKDLADLLAAADTESLGCRVDVFEGLPKEDASCR